MKTNIPKDKEEKIFQVALTEFAKEGYKNTSTNNIVKKCNISKGALFNYFDNKHNLYLYVVRKSLKIIEEEMISKMNNLSSDMFERVFQVQKIKIVSFLKYPRESQIILEVFSTEEENFREDLKDEYKYYEDMARRVTNENIDYSKFKEGVDIQQVFTTLLLISYGYKEYLGSKILGDFNVVLENIDEILKVLEGCINLIKNSVYK